MTQAQRLILAFFVPFFLMALIAGVFGPSRAYPTGGTFWGATAILWIVGIAIVAAIVVMFIMSGIMGRPKGGKP